jgi:hypothetical protein
VAVRQGTARSVVHEVSELGFLIGTVPGCDLRLSGADLPPVICLITRHAGGASLRKLVPTQPVAINGRAATNGPLANGDRVTLGAVELLVQIAAPPEPAGEAHSGPVLVATQEILDRSRSTVRATPADDPPASARAVLEARQQAANATEEATGTEQSVRSWHDTAENKPTSG